MFGPTDYAEFDPIDYDEVPTTPPSKKQKAEERARRTVEVERRWAFLYKEQAEKKAMLQNDAKELKWRAEEEERLLSLIE